MSGAQRTARSSMPCSRCKAPMDELVSIAPVVGEPGLVAYECPKCGYVTSVLVQPASAENRTSKPRKR
jgi:hypothetical protein